MCHSISAAVGRCCLSRSRRAEPAQVRDVDTSLQLLDSRAHCAHDERKIAGALQYPGSVIVAPAVQDQFSRKPCCTTSLAEFLVHGCQMSRSRESLNKKKLFCARIEDIDWNNRA